MFADLYLRIPAVDYLGELEHVMLQTLSRAEHNYARMAVI